AGDININASITWGGGSKLTFKAFRNIVVADGVTISNPRGFANLSLHADDTGHGVGTVIFLGTGNIDYTNSGGSISIFYNPSSFTTPTDYAPNVKLFPGAAPQLTAYMLINNLAELQAINTNLSGDYALGRDINATTTARAHPFTPIGDAITTVFTGTLEGEGHIINKLNIHSGAFEAIGLFGGIGTNGVVSDLGLTNERL